MNDRNKANQNPHWPPNEVEGPESDLRGLFAVNGTGSDMHGIEIIE
jgi:hypothetical protein